jgi:16S rRNA (cytosine967-C5)-methyltransferase
MKKDPRNLALKVLNRIGDGDRTLDGVLEKAATADAFESRRDRALFNALVYGVLRWRRKLDHILDHLVDRPLKKIDPRVLDVLRLGLYQIVYLDRVPDSAAVNTAVNLVRRLPAEWAVGFVNAVLRRAVREHQQVPFPSGEIRDAASLALNKSFPEWIIKRWLARFGAGDTIRLCDTLNQPATLTLRANTLKIGAAELLPRIGALSQGAVRTSFAPDGIRNCRAAATLFEHPIFHQGLCAVQDEAAQLIALLVDPRPGDRVLDGCAGQGGKSAHMAALMQDRGEIVAVDRSAKRLERLVGEMKRLGVSIVTPLELDLDRAVNSKDLEHPFDRILIDAPCSGLGVIRRNPDIKWSPLKQDLGRYRNIQSGLLDLAAPLVKPGGVLVYAVCSSEPEETETVIADFLKNHPEFAINTGSEALTGARFQPLLVQSCFCTYPKHVEMDGFFGARLKRMQ